MDVFGLCDIYSCAVGDTVYIRKVTQIFAGIHPCKFRKFPVSGFYIIRDRRTALRGFTGFGFCQRFRKLSVVVQNLIGLTHGNLMVSSNVGDAFPVLVFYRNPLAYFFRQLLAVEGMMCPVFLDKPRNESRCDIVPYCDILYP